MNKFIIERDFPGAGNLTPEQLRATSQASNDVLSTMPGRAQWLESYVTDDKLFCVYLADEPEAIREHASKGGFPVTSIHRARRDSSTGRSFRSL